MTDEPSTEHDLRDALHALVPADLDASDFRARLDRLLSDEPAEPPASGGASDRPDEVLELTVRRAELPQRRRARRTALVATIAACAAAVTAGAIAIVPHGHGHGDRTPPLHSTATVPAAVRSMLYPGTIVLRTYSGQGSRTYPVAPRAIPAHYGYEAYGTCSGAGNLTIAQQTLLDVCQTPHAAFGTTEVVEKGRLVITANPRTRWQITLTIAPDAQTNGSVQNPVDAGMSGPDTELRRSGRGTATVRLGSAASGDEPVTAYRLSLVCHGSGVSLPGLTADRASGLRTRTCFAGHEYVWDGVHLTAPADVRVVATAGTTWTIVLQPR